MNQLRAEKHNRLKTKFDLLENREQIKELKTVSNLQWFGMFVLVSAFLWLCIQVSDLSHRVYELDQMLRFLIN